MSITDRINNAAADTLLVNQLDSSLSRLQTLEQQTTSGRIINQPSDNPAGTATAMALNSQISALNAYSSSASNGVSMLTAAGSALSSVTNSLLQVQTDLMTGANTSAEDQTTLAGLAQNVQTIKQDLIDTANSSYGGTPLFSGTWSTLAYGAASSGNYSYTGGSQPIQATVGNGVQVPVTVTGSSVFGSGTSSVFAVLDQISSDIKSGNGSALSGTDLSQLQAAMANVSNSEAVVGGRQDELQAMQTQMTTNITTLQSNVSSIVDANEAEVASELSLQETQYQAALAAVAKVIQPTLAGFLS